MPFKSHLKHLKVPEKMAQAPEPEPFQFAQAIGSVRPIHTNTRPKSVPSLHISRRIQESFPRENGEGVYIGDHFDDDAPNWFAHPSVAKRILHEMREGRRPIAARVDLHGMTRVQAQEALNAFIQRLAIYGSVGEVVHGSGLGSAQYKPILKSMVRHWLMAHPQVLAYTQAHPANDGAVLVLVQRRARQHPFEPDEKYASE